MQQAQTPPPLTFEQVMAIMDKQFIEQRTDMLIKFEEERKLRMAELDKQFAKRDEEFAKYEALRKAEMEKHEATRKAEMEKFSKEMGQLSNRFGEVIEYMIAPDICEKMNEFGFNFQHAIYRQPVSHNHKTLTEIDILLEDDGDMMAIEVKTKPTTDDVIGHLKRLNTIQKYPPRSVRGAKLYGAIAGAVVKDDVRKLAFK